MKTSKQRSEKSYWTIVQKFSAQGFNFNTNKVHVFINNDLMIPYAVLVKDSNKQFSRHLV